MKIMFFSSISLFFIVSAFARVMPDMPIKSEYNHSLQYEWAQKQVLDSLLLSDMENTENWIHTGFGAMSLSKSCVHSGNKSLLLTSPTKGIEPGPERGRPFGAASLIYKPANSDLSEWNRISFWVYPNLPGFKIVSLSLVLHNDGIEKVPGPYDRNGLNYVVIENQKWQQFFWEIEHLGRDNVTAIELRYRLQGNEPGAADSVEFYFDNLSLQKVKPDHYEGWNTADDMISWSHIGYATGFPKIAITSAKVGEFILLDSNTGQKVYNAKVKAKKSQIGTFSILDFSDFDKPGSYVLKAEGITTRPFLVGDFNELFYRSIIKTINHFYCQRCGTNIEGIHDVCHRDWICTHNDQSVVINGGWHDAGDLSQGLTNTSESTFSMLELAEHLKERNPQLAERLLQEAKWGLDWMLKTRFSDGYRCNWATMDFWTDGIIGTVDDVTSRAWNHSVNNFKASQTEAMASIAFQDTDVFLSDYTFQCAVDDWEFARLRNDRFNIDHAAAGLNASLMLFRINGDEKYKTAALEYVRYISSCQQKEPLSDKVKLTGFFYRTPEKKSILHYEHVGQEQNIIMALIGMCKQFPDDKDFKTWHHAIELYAQYYLNIYDKTAPWYMLPAGIYDLEAAKDDTESEQIKNGLKLDDRYYLKNFPVWKTFRGNMGTVLSQTKALVEAADYLKDTELKELCYRQLQWVLGLNPFNQSLMYGEGYRFSNQYSAMSGNITGGLPVGIQTHYNRDEPYWPTENCYNWKEIWVHPSGRWLWLMCNFMEN